MIVDLISKFLDYKAPPTKLETLFKLNGYNKNDGTIVCPRCNGEGKHYYIEDNDCVEGYKMADKKTCKLCHGKTRILSHWLLDKYSIEVNEYKKHVDRYNKTAIILSTIRSKLTVREREMLGLAKPIPKLKDLKYAVPISKD